MRKLLIWGASGHARVVAEIARLDSQFEVVGFIDNTAAAAERFLDTRVYHDLDELETLRDQGVTDMIIAVGDCRARMRLAGKAAAAGFTLKSAVHPRAIVSSEACIGAGTVIAAGAVVNPGCSIGANVIVNTGATVDHDSLIADGVHIGPGAHLGGWVTVGEATWLGIGTIVSDRITIGRNSVVGAGAVVVSDIPDLVTAWGLPAKPMKQIPS